MTVAELRAQYAIQTEGLPPEFHFENVRAAWLKRVKEQIDITNSGLVGGFNGAWSIFLEALTHGPATPPAPPLAWVLDDSGVWPAMTLGTEPVCPQPPLPDLSEPLPGNIEIDFSTRQRWGSETWYTAGRKDRTENGTVTPPILSPDGQRHVYQKFGSPVGLGHYLLVG